MKRLLIGALALLTAAAPVAVTASAAAQPGRDVREARQDRREAVRDLNRADTRREARDARQDLRQANRDLTRAQNRRQIRRWRTGQRLNRNYGSYYAVNDWRTRRLRAPPRGYRWYRQGNDYVLAAVAGGLIASVIAASR